MPAWETLEPGGCTPLYKLYRYVSPHRVGFLRRCSLKTGIHIAQFGLESGMLFEGTTGMYERLIENRAAHPDQEFPGLPPSPPPPIPEAGIVENRKASAS